MVISESKNGEATSYTYGLERISAISGNTRTEYVYDGRGSVAAEVSYNNAWYTFGGSLSKKNVVSKSYSPFGELLTENTSGFGYNGEYYNAATGMIYLRARFYEPEMNRFGQKDVIRGSILDPLGLNRYPYCANDPVNFSDPSGMALVRNNMVMVNDGGGGSGKKMNAPASNLLQKAGQAIKTAVRSVAAAANQSRASARSNGEAIVVSGYEHKIGRFKYNFIESGIRGINNFLEEGLKNITWIVFTDNYSNNDLNNFEETARSLDVNFISVNSAQEFINYLNTGDTSEMERMRANKITNMVIYGHGYPGLLDLNIDGIRQDDLMKLKPGVFENTNTVLYTCRGANETAYGPAIAQMISDITGGETTAIYGRAEYAYIAYSEDDLESRSSYEKELIRTGQFWKWLLFKLQDDEIETLRKGLGYLQNGALYDPIPGKQAQDWLTEEERDPSYWVTFTPTD